MHELAVAAELLELARRVAADEGARRVTVIRLRLGAASCLSPDSLSFGLEALAAGTATEGCRLEVERVPAPVSCPACGWRGEVRDMEGLICDLCRQTPLTILGGREMTVVSLDVE
jgi:hydrogenase nickel incorporation protein HypA/HybF